jgi:hypothetical protein
MPSVKNSNGGELLRALATLLTGLMTRERKAMRMTKMIRWTSTLRQFSDLTLVLLILTLSGCSTGILKGRPEPLAFQGQLTKALIEKYSKTNAIPSDGSSITEDKRNQILNDLIYLTDVNYYKFTGALYEGRAMFDTSSDLTMLGLGAAGALTPAASTKAILAAISGGIAGSRVSINKNFFQEQATTALIAKMDAARKTQLALMQDAMAKLSVKDYPLSRGLAQVAEYYNAGTLVGALQNITATAGAEKATADQDLKDTINLTYGADVNTALLRTVDRKKLEDWMRANGIKVSITALYYSTECASNREQAVKALKLSDIKPGDK